MYGGRTVKSFKLPFTPWTDYAWLSELGRRRGEIVSFATFYALEPDPALGRRTLPKGYTVVRSVSVLQKAITNSKKTRPYICRHLYTYATI